MAKTKKQIKKRGGLNENSTDVKSKLGHTQSGKLHSSAKRLIESIDKEKEDK
ncbi:MAG: hypothetical protein ACI9AT_000433 [Ulvibacter sp.]